MSQEPPKPLKVFGKEYHAAWRARNKDRVKASQDKYYRDHKERCVQRALRVRREITDRNPEHYKLYMAKHRRAKPQVYKAYSIVARGKRKKLLSEPNFNGEQLVQKLDYYGRKCVYCGRGGKLEWDHVKPISKGGLNLLCNLVPACRSCNAIKRCSWKGVQWWLRCIDYGLTELQNKTRDSAAPR